VIRGAFSAAACALAVALGAAPARGAPPLGPAFDAQLPPLARAAVADLVQLDAARLRSDADPQPLHTALVRGAAAIRAERLRANRDADPLLETTLAENAALLLHLRVQEAIAFHLGDDTLALGFAAAADSLAAALDARIVVFPNGDAAIMPLAAGLAAPRAVASALAAQLRARWGEMAAQPGTDPALRVLLMHVAAASDSMPLAPPRRDGVDVARDATLAAVAARRLAPFRGDDPGRRLVLAVRALRADGAVSAAALARARFLARAAAPDADTHARRHAAADSLLAVLNMPDARAAPIHGSRRDYYRKPGEPAPSLDAAADAAARSLARAALRALRAAAGDAALGGLGVRMHADPDPFEVVPEQAMATVWTVAAASGCSFSVRAARLGGEPVGVTPTAGTVPPGGSLQLRTAFASIGARAPGDFISVTAELQLDVAGFGAVDVVDRVTAQVVAPVQATLVPIGGPLMHGDDKAIDVVVTSRAPYAFAGGLTVLATHDWRIMPAAAFRFTLRRPGQSARQRLVLTLPRSAAPGEYELALRLDADAAPVGTLRTTLVRPLRWAVAGPFPAPGPGARLAPENGVALEARYPGLDGTQIAWQAVPDDAYDADGGLDLDALLPRQGRTACACAFTVLESAEVGAARLVATGADRMRWNGIAPAAGGRVRVERGHNLLLVRSCSRGGEWRLGVELTDERGAALHVLANDLERLLNGYAALVTAAPQRRAGKVDRVVTLRFDGSAGDVDVLGSFNAWVPLDLQRQPDGTWERDLRLSPGRYAYKLLVDGKLRTDPSASAFESDGFGGRNSLLIVR
jgi:hypothetical protein